MPSAAPVRVLSPPARPVVLGPHDEGCTVDPRRPMRPPPWVEVASRLRRCSAPGDTLPIAALSGISAVATVLSPALLAHPLVLVALTPRMPFLVLACGQGPLTTFLAVGCLRLCLADVFWFRIGRRAGPGVLGRLPRPCRRLVTRSPRTRDIVLAILVLVRPVGRHLAAAAAVGMRPGLVVLLDVVGTLAFLLAVYFGTAAVF